MGGHRLVPDDVVLASKKLGRDDGVALAKTCDTVIVARGKKVTTFEVSAYPGDEMVLSRAGRAQDFPRAVPTVFPAPPEPPSRS